MRIGPYLLENNLLLAPMAGITDLPFRRLCRRLGAGLAVSEMVSSSASLRAHRKTLRRLDFTGEPGPLAVQLLGADPVALAEAARVNVDYGAQIIDLNMGCPAKKVCKVAAGSALLRDESLVARILEAVVGAVSVPVTLKIRTGWDSENRNGVAIARIAEQSGIAALAVHGRTRACGFSGEAEFDTIRAIRAAVSIPVTANGDIDGPEKALAVLNATGVDGLMIGRAARGRPWIFREIEHYLRTGHHPPPLSPSRKCELALEHLSEIYRFYGSEHGIHVARKHIAWYGRGLADAAHWRERIFASSTAAGQMALIQQIFDRWTPPQELAA